MASLRFLGSLLSLALLTCDAVVAPSMAAEVSPLRQAYAGNFLIGVALSTVQIDGRNAKAAAIAAEHFASVTPENDMKWQAVHPQPERYDFKAADAYVDFAQKHGIALIGHALVWHSQTPDWVFQGADGKPATREELLQRLRTHIHTVVGRYKGKIKGWDVVNEALSDSGPDMLRDSPWHRIIGDDFLDHAFRFAREADPSAELYYNDYNLEDPRKRANCAKLLRGLLDRGVPITGVGTQSHFQLEYPSLAEIEKTITTLSALGLKVMITELDIDVLPSRGQPGLADISRRETADKVLDPYKAGLPAELQTRLAARYASLLDLYRRHRSVVTRVTFWGLDDGQTWLNDFPIPGRTNHPLLFDRALQPKPAFFAVLRKTKPE